MSFCSIASRVVRLLEARGHAQVSSIDICLVSKQLRDMWVNRPSVILREYELVMCISIQWLSVYDSQLLIFVRGHAVEVEYCFLESLS